MNIQLTWKWLIVAGPITIMNDNHKMQNNQCFHLHYEFIMCMIAVEKTCWEEGINIVDINEGDVVQQMDRERLKKASEETVYKISVSVASF